MCKPENEAERMTTIEQLKKRAEKLAPEPDKEYHSHSKEDEQAINAIIREVWPSFDEDNPDLLTPDGVARVFADPRYREIERRIFAIKTDQGPAVANAGGSLK
jgi:hypothetical protein